MAQLNTLPLSLLIVLVLFDVVRYLSPRLDWTYCVVAIWVVFVPLAAVGAAGVPVNVGEADNTVEPVPVEVVTPVPPLATGRVPVTPVVSGRPVALVKVRTEGVSRLGVTKTGELANTRFPDPVSSDTIEDRLALVGVCRNDETPVPRPVTPVIATLVAVAALPVVF